MKLPQTKFTTLLLFLLFPLLIFSQNPKEEKDTLLVGNYFDGPHVKYISKNRVEVFYVSHDSLKNHTRKITKSFRFKNDTIRFRGFVKPDSKQYVIPRNISQPEGVYDSADKIIVLGDIHGELKALQTILRNNQVIDENDQWIFGNGHIVFTGDVFDRGEQVTECLWLIYQLELQAKKAGGNVHYILGNHELMVMMFDDRYIADKYKHASRFMETHYSLFYTPETVLGKWLRSKNILVKIDQKLFVHGGISPQFLERKMDIDSVNSTMQQILRDYTQVKDSTLTDLFLYSYGPLWYRGYLSKTPKYDRISLKEVNRTLEFYQAMVIIFGHTPVSRIYPFYSSKLIAMDVPIGDTKYNTQGLLIENQKYYRIFADRKKEELQ